MQWPELTPRKVPIACFGFEYIAEDPTCRKCPHRAECCQYMLSRAQRVTLDKARFNLVPEGYSVNFNSVDADDPEIPMVQSVYAQCYETVFERKPQPVNLKNILPKLIQSTKNCKCSIRLYMLANMLGHKRLEDEIIAKTPLANVPPFTPAKLVGTSAEKRVHMYADLCRKNYGTFTLSALSTLAETDMDSNSLDNRMLKSEINAGLWITRFKSKYGGPAYARMYANIVLELDPYWLATEDTFKTLVLNDKSAKPSAVERMHYYSAIQAVAQMHRNRQLALSVFKFRQDCMSKAISTVLERFGHKPSDFEVTAEPVTNTLEMWTMLGRAIQHWNLTKYLHGDASIFTDDP